MSSARAQRGAALMALVAVLVMAVLAGIISLVNAALSQGTTARNHNAVVLQQAKTALLGHVVKEVLDLTNDTPGRFPCPESPGDAGTSLEGRAAGSCSPTFPANKTVGRLPWRTLGVDKLVDAHAEPLWYAVSPSWVLNGGPAPTINGGTAGELTVDGIGDVVAIIIAPGAPLTIAPNAAQVTAGCPARVQQRADRSHVAASTDDPDFRDYLECENATATPNATFGTSVVDNATNPALNDQAVYITARDVLSAIQGPLTERMQRTVAPLLSEFSRRWPSGTFMPYAASFRPPEDTTVTQQSLCGPAAPTAQLREGLLPLASATSSGTCSSAWTNVTMTGTSNVSFPFGTACSVASGTATCRFRYYEVQPLGGLLALILPVIMPAGSTATVTIQATAPHGAATFREPLVDADVVVNPSSGITKAAPSTLPVTNGNAQLTQQIQATSRVCVNATLPLVGPVVCETINALLGSLIVSNQDVTVTIPSMSSPVLTGADLSTQVRAAHPGGSHDLVNPAPTAANYWFMQNQWYRYTYYAVSPNASADASGGDLMVNEFPAEFGSPGDKRFVLALVGPGMTGQTRGPTANLDQYLEGINAATSPRTAFAYQVYSSSGNDRLVTCPYATVCD